nr:uncharacterized protein LOC120348678 isoform X2 [Styela clava]
MHIHMHTMRKSRKKFTMNLYVLSIFLVAGIQISGSSAQEFIPTEFFKQFDDEVSPNEASMFDFPMEKGFDRHKHKRCARFRYSSPPEDSCDVHRSPSGSCRSRKCTQASYYGSSKCMKQVKLYRPFYHGGVECISATKACSGSDADPTMYPMPRENLMYPEPVEANDEVGNGCECQTIWFLRQIHTIYEIEEMGKLFKGNVTVKIPRKCECRRKKIQMGPNYGR